MKSVPQHFIKKGAEKLELNVLFATHFSNYILKLVLIFLKLRAQLIKIHLLRLSLVIVQDISKPKLKWHITKKI